MATNQMNAPRMVRAKFDHETSSLKLWATSRLARDEISVRLSKEERDTLAQMCRDFSDWSECNLERTNPDQLVFVRKMPEALGIRVEEKERAFSVTFLDLKVLDMMLVFEGEQVEAVGRGIVDVFV